MALKRWRQPAAVVVCIQHSSCLQPVLLICPHYGDIKSYSEPNSNLGMYTRCISDWLDEEE